MGDSTIQNKLIDAECELRLWLRVQVKGLGFGVQGLGFRVKVLGFRVYVAVLKV